MWLRCVCVGSHLAVRIRNERFQRVSEEQGNRGKFPGPSTAVMAGLVPAIHAVMLQESLQDSGCPNARDNRNLKKDCFCWPYRTAWMARTSLAMTLFPLPRNSLQLEFLIWTVWTGNRSKFPGEQLCCVGSDESCEVWDFGSRETQAIAKVVEERDSGVSSTSWRGRA